MALWEFSLLLLAILAVGGLAWMSTKKHPGGIPRRERIRSAQRKPGGSNPPIRRQDDMEAAEEMTPPLLDTVSPRPADLAAAKHGGQVAQKDLPRREAEHPLPSIPYRYGDTYLTAMVRDPYWLFAYWEIGKAAKEDVCRRYGARAWESSRPVLKVYDATNRYFFDSRQAAEIEINDFADNWYIHTGKPGHSYFIELSRVMPDGTQIFIARSNMVTTPRDDVSEIVSSEWLLPTTYEKKVYGRYIDVHGSPGFIEEMSLKAGAAKKLEEEQISSPMNW